MKYVGMPFGMWVLFAGSFQKQLIAVLGYDTATARAEKASLPQRIIAAMKATAALKAADRQRRLACGYDGVSLSRHLHRIRLPGAVPLLLRQRRHQLRRVASEADLGEKHDAGTRQ